MLGAGQVGPPFSLPQPALFTASLPFISHLDSLTQVVGHTAFEQNTQPKMLGQGNSGPHSEVPYLGSGIIGAFLKSAL